MSAANVGDEGFGIAARKAGGASLTDAATRFLRDRILDLTLEPGEPIEEKSLLGRFGLSRTPAREAINRLIAEGLVTVRSNRGAFVAPMDLEGLVALLDAYVLAERMVASVCKLEHPRLADDLRQMQASFVRAAAKMDLLRITEINARFHGRIARAVENRFVEQYSADLHNLARRASFYIYRRQSREQGSISEPGDRVIAQHEMIIASIAERDRASLVSVVTEHALLFRERFEELLKSSGFETAEFAPVGGG